MLTRRQLLQRGAIGGAGLVVGRAALAVASPPGVGVTPRLRKWVEPLPVPPVLDGRGGGKRFAIAARESTFWKFHPDLPPTRTWGYWSDDPAAGLPYLGPTILATSRPNDSVETSVTVDWRNQLGNAFLPNDPTLRGAVMPGEPAPMVTHLHGGENLPQFDGTPLQWFTNGGETGPYYITNKFTYYNEQRASMVWYHDHALGNTRTNVYAGLAGAYIIRDDQDTGEPDNPLGFPTGRYEIPLVLQDKTFNADGSMFYPTQGVTAYHPQWVPEFFGDVAVINAKIWPFVDVEPRRYRLRIVNGSQSRFYNLRFVHEHNGRALPFTQIGAEGGLLRAPVAMTALLIAPGERADLIIDFAGHGHASFIVTNDARAPYPAGARATLTQLLKIRVNRKRQGVDRTTPPSRLRLPALAALPAPSRKRVQHLSETLDPLTGAPIRLSVEDGPFLSPHTGLPAVTTKPAAGATEDWLLVNTTADTHPIHLHVVTFEVIDRRPFDAAAYDPATKAITYTGPPVPAAPNENSRKDTVQSHPGQVTRIRARFDLPDEGTIQLPPGVANPQYVWHCHILEHEENDMMRAFEVVR
ncbi:MAG: multicopper oxidase family protein [Solirubrobacteraceae bacterium]